MIIWYRSVYKQIASDAWRYNNPVYKIMTDKLHLMLINVLLDQFLNIKVSQGSVATRIRRDGIFNDQFITRSLLSKRVKKWKSVDICRSYGKLSTGCFFNEIRCINAYNKLSPPLSWALCGRPYIRSRWLRPTFASFLIIGSEKGHKSLHNIRCPLKYKNYWQISNASWLENFSTWYNE